MLLLCYLYEFSRQSEIQENTQIHLREEPIENAGKGLSAAGIHSFIFFPPFSWFYTPPIVAISVSIRPMSSLSAD
jgi:hypothetical protein